jgi:hypothetical protein
MVFKQWLLEMVFFLKRIHRKGGFGIVVLDSRKGLWFIERVLANGL